MRVIIDTNIARNIIHGRQPEAKDMLDSLEWLNRTHGPIHITIAYTTYLELIEDLYATHDGTGIPWAHWNKNIGQLTPLIDPSFPILPDFPELCELIGINPSSGGSGATSAISAARWKLLTTSTSPGDLNTGVSVPDGSGSVIQAINSVHAKAALDSKRASYFTNLAKYAAQPGPPYNPFNREKVVADFKKREFGDVSAAIVSRIDPFLVLLARNIREIQTGSDLAKKYPSIAFDNDMLLALGLPAIICTRDLKLLNIVQNEGKYHRADEVNLTCGLIIPPELASGFVTGHTTILVIFPKKAPSTIPSP